MQDTDILMNMMASTDIFELVIDMMSMQINEDNNGRVSLLGKTKGGNKMIELYVSLILKGKKTINDVPSVIKPQVKAMLNDLGVEY